MGEKTKTATKRQFSAGGVVYKDGLWLVTCSSPSELFPKAYWRLPKGWIDEGETQEEAAIREVKEEGGVEAKIIAKIETIKYFFNFNGDRIMKFVTFFLMEWEKDLPDGFGFETSEIAWLEFAEARKKLSFSNERKILDQAIELFEARS